MRALGNTLAAIILAVAAIAVAIIVVGMITGMLPSFSARPSVDASTAKVFTAGNNINVTFVLRNPTSHKVHIQEVTIYDDSGNAQTLQGVAPVDIDPHTDVEIAGYIPGGTANFGDHDKYRIIVKVTYGDSSDTLVFDAVYLG